MGDEGKDWGPVESGGEVQEGVGKEEEIRAFAPHLFRWHGPKAKFFLFGTVQGTLVVTDRRLLFLTGGDSWFTSQFSALGQQLSGGVRLADIDLTQLGNPESIAMPLYGVERFEVVRRWDFASYLTLAGTDEEGEEVCVAFMPKLGLNASQLRSLVEAATGTPS
jgi:hypothetical protein